MATDSGDFFHADDHEPIIASEGQITPVPWLCEACGEVNETFLDLTGGYRQRYTEDCGVCCRPNLITVTVAVDTMEVELRNELEYE